MSRESSRNSNSTSYVDEGAGDSDEETYVDDWLKSTAPAAPARAASQSLFLSSSSASSRPQAQQSTHGKPSKQQPMLKCGWLQKRGEVSQQWKQKWVVLRRGSLEYHKDAESAQRGDIQGTILLADVEIKREMPTTGEFDPAQELAGRSFGLQLPPPNEHLLYPFRAATLKERTAWLTMIERALKPVGASAAPTPASAATPSPIASASSASFASSTRWQHDELCYGCRKEFTLTHRRHHCRRCGHAFCQPCSSKRYRLPGSEQAVRVCDDCMNILHAPPPRIKTAEEKKEESEARLRAQRAQQAETDRLAAAAAAASAATAAAAAAAILGATALNNSARKPGAGAAAGPRKSTADSWESPAGRGGSGRSESVSVSSTTATHRMRTTRPEKARALYAPPPPAPSSAAAAAASAAAGSHIAMRAVGPSASSSNLHSATGAPVGRSHAPKLNASAAAAGDGYVAFNDQGREFDDIRHDTDSDDDEDEDGSRRRRKGMCACLG